MFKHQNLNVLQIELMEYFKNNLYKINKITFLLEINSDKTYLINFNNKNYSNKSL